MAKSAFEYNSGLLSNAFISAFMTEFHSCLKVRERINPNDLSDYKHYNWKYLSNGIASRAWSFKIGVAEYVMKCNNGYERDGQPTWLEYCCLHQDKNPFIPRVHYFYRCKDSSAYICVMEKLAPAKLASTYFAPIFKDLSIEVIEDIRNKVNPDIYKYVKRIAEFKTMADKGGWNSHQSIIDHLNTSNSGCVRKYAAEIISFFQNDEFEEAMSILASAMKALVERKGAGRIDLHSDNVMLRIKGGKQQLVILDPLIAN